MNFFRFFLIILRLSPGLFFLNLVSICLMGAFDTLTILGLAPIIDGITNTTGEVSGVSEKFAKFYSFIGVSPSLKVFIITFLILIIAKSVFSLVYRYVSLHTKYFFIKKFISDAFRSFLNGGMSFFNSEKQGVLLNTFNSDINTVGNSLTTMSVFLSNLIHIIFYFLIPLSISVKLTLFAGAAFALVVLPTKLIDRLSYKRGRQNVETANRMNIILQESLSAMKVVLAFGKKEDTIKKHVAALDEHRHAAISFQMIGHLVSAIYEPVLVFVLFGVLYIARSHFSIAISEIFIILYSFKMVVPIIISTVKDKNAIIGFLPSYEQITRLCSQAEGMRIREGSVPFTTLSSGIEFKDVVFSYHQQPVLKGLSFKIRKGEKIALVGKSGSGKTTIVDLLLGLYKTQHGDILIDGRSLYEFELDTFRRKIGYVPQDPVLFNESLRENLLWSLGAHDVLPESEIKAVLEKSNAIDFVEKMPEGLATPMGERGTKLSGGERQRIALSRALIRKPELLVLDEATSALDNRSEKLIQDAVDSLGKDITVVVIAHRLSTIKKVDRILYLEEGKVVEEGTYDELIIKQGNFSLLASQLH